MDIYENIFKDAKFGDKFVTRDGRIAIYMFNKDGLYLLVPESYYSFNAYHSDGREIENEEHNIDIVSRYPKPIDEKNLDDLATKKSYEVILHDGIRDFCTEYCYELGYKAGYREAKLE